MMKRTARKPRIGRPGFATALIAGVIAALSTGGANAGGLLLYEIGTADVGLASAGYGARAQDASTLMTNPAGMTRLDGTQLLLGIQAAYGDPNLSIDRTTNTATGGAGGNPVGWQPGGGGFVSYSVSPNVKVGFGVSGNFGLTEKYDSGWAGRYYGTESTLMGISLMPSVAYRVNDNLSLGATLNAMYGILKNKVAVNNITPGLADGELKFDDKQWGYGATLGLLYEASSATRLGLTYNSQIDLDFSPRAEFSGLAPGLNSVLAARGLLNATVNIGIKVPQGVMGSVYHQMNERWAVLGSVGWQEWSKFGQVEIGVDSNNPTSLTADLKFKDTWHAAIGAQYQPSGPWLYSFGIGYDSQFQDSDNVPPMLAANDAWRFGVGAQMQSSKNVNWGVAAEYVYGGTLKANKKGLTPVALGGRGDFIGSFKDSAMYFLSANWTWKF